MANKNALHPSNTEKEHFSFWKLKNYATLSVSNRNANIFKLKSVSVLYKIRLSFHQKFVVFEKMSNQWFNKYLITPVETTGWFALQINYKNHCRNEVARWFGGGQLMLIGYTLKTLHIVCLSTLYFCGGRQKNAHLSDDTLSWKSTISFSKLSLSRVPLFKCLSSVPL